MVNAAPLRWWISRLYNIAAIRMACSLSQFRWIESSEMSFSSASAHLTLLDNSGSVSLTAQNFKPNSFHSFSDPLK